jgi:hypothetical protein
MTEHFSLNRKARSALGEAPASEHEDQSQRAKAARQLLGSKAALWRCAGALSTIPLDKISRLGDAFI